MNKIYHLSSCSTCKRIISELGESNFELINIKDQNIDEETLNQLAMEHGSYEALFNKRAIKYRSQGLNQKELSEKDYKKLILEEYTFLKRPIVFIGDKSFVGNAKKTVQDAKNALN